MRKRYIAVAAFCAVVAGLGGLGSSPALAQEDSGRDYLVVGAQAKDRAKNCCAYMGVFMEELSVRTREKLKYPYKTGILIASVVPGSPAEKAGLMADDIVYLFNGIKVEETGQLADLVQKQEVGDKVPLVVYRDGDEKKLSVILEKREPIAVLKDEFGGTSEKLNKVLGSVKESMELYKQSYLTRGRLGMVLGDLNEDLAPYFGVKANAGALVLDVETGSTAEKAGVKSGDVIVSVNGEAVAGVGDVSDALADLETGDTASIKAVRKGAEKVFELTMEEGSASFRFYVAPFEQGRSTHESLDQYMTKKNSDEATKLKEEMHALQERLKELEDRLDKAEKRE